MSKGHAALALYAALRLRGWLAAGELETFCGPSGGLGVHPEPGTAGVDFGTGSLGQGLSYGAGAVLAARLQGSPRRTFVLVSDAECNEGAFWEAVMFAAHHRLSALVAIVDVNGQQALGYTKDVLDLEPLGPRFTSFGWDVVEVDGHDTVALKEALSQPASPGGAPRVVLARTIFGKGVSFMERRVAWHYLPLTAEQYAVALAEVGDEGHSP
jgi:transketolase